MITCAVGSVHSPRIARSRCLSWLWSRQTPLILTWVSSQYHLSPGVAAEPGRVGQQRSEPLHPPVDGDVVDLDATLDQQLFNISVRQVEPQVPAEGDDDHLRRKPEPNERRRWRLPQGED